MNGFCRFLLAFLLLFSFACQPSLPPAFNPQSEAVSSAVENPKIAEIQSAEIKKLLESAIEQTNVTKTYDPA